MLLEHDEEIRTLLSNATTIAVVGLSAKPYRDSYRVAQYLLRHGYTIIPVNPHVNEVFGLRAYSDLPGVPSSVDIVNIFRRPEFVPGIVNDAIAAGARTVWMQLGVGHSVATQTAIEAGLSVVVNRCIMVEHRRFTHG
ncbi:MAG: CoA-binding protein [Ignavibacteria bacterium]|nr:CoA-binding protein [Ignavibacteria bacterium]